MILRFQEYEKKLQENKQQNKKPRTPAALALQAKRAKLSQAKINFKVISPLSKSEQMRIDKLVIDYIVSEARPLHTVEEPSFLAMCHGFNPQAKVIGVKKVNQLIIAERENFIREVPEILSPVKEVCLAVDMWSTSHRAFIGITCHWIGIDEAKKRRSLALSCQRFIGEFSVIPFHIFMYLIFVGENC